MESVYILAIPIAIVAVKIKKVYLITCMVLIVASGAAKTTAATKKTKSP